MNVTAAKSLHYCLQLTEPPAHKFQNWLITARQVAFWELKHFSGHVMSYRPFSVLSSLIKYGI